MIQLNKLENENNEQYKWRLYKAKSAGLIDLSWEQLGAKIDENLRPGEAKLNESVYRKEAAIVSKFYDGVLTSPGNEEQIALLEQIKKERIKLRDERTDLNKQLRSLARNEQQIDYLVDVLKAQGNERYKAPVEPDILIEQSDNEMIVMLSDLHIGACFDNEFGSYDSSKAKRMMDEYLGKVLNNAAMYSCNTIHVMLLGDMLSGSIHKSISVTNRENVIDQIKVASILIGDFIYSLSRYFVFIDVTSVSGNHTRIEKKEDALKDERLDELLPFIVEMRLSHLGCVRFNKSMDTTLAKLSIHGKTYVAVHGDMDDMSRDSVAKLTMMLGEIPYCVCMGHMHHAEYRDVCGVKMVMGGSLQGSGDDYTVSKRLSGKPSQTILVCGKEGIVAHIPVEFK